jgi:hypothetical protein
MNHQQLFTEIGRLFYAVANADGEIKSKEIISIRDLLNIGFIPFEEQSDQNTINCALYAEYEFESLMEIEADGEMAFFSFLDFFSKNQRDIDDQLKEFILKSVEELADSFHGKNRFELFYLDKLKQVFELPISHSLP